MYSRLAKERETKKTSYEGRIQKMPRIRKITKE